MKKRLFLMLTIILSVSLFTACSSDKDDEIEKELKELNGDYGAYSSSSQFELTYSKAPMYTSNQASFKATGGDKGVITLNSVIPGESTTELNVTLGTTTRSSQYYFEGEDKTSERTVAYKGSILKGKLTLSLEVTTTKQDIMSTWRVDETDPIHLVWTVSKPEFEPVVQMIEAYKPQLSGLLQSVLYTIKIGTDGTIIAQYRDLGSDETAFKPSPANYVHYYLKDSKLYALLNMEMILQEVTNRTSPMPALTALIYNGIPVNYKITGTKMDLFVDKDLIMTLFNDSTIQALLNEAIAGMDESEQQEIGAMLESLAAALAATTKLEIGLNMINHEVMN